MKTLKLSPVAHQYAIGQKPADLAPNVTEDCLLESEEGELLGLFMRQAPPSLSRYMDAANAEFRTSRVPKLLMNRSSAIQKAYREHGTYRSSDAVQQYSTILGAVLPRPHMRRNYPSTSSVHQKPSARPFIKAMLLAARECQELMKATIPDIYHRQAKLMAQTPPKWKFGELWTSSISNYNIAAAYHRDSKNIRGCVNVIMTKRNGAAGGNLHVPGYDAIFDQCDGSVLIYPAWRDVHGVTPIHATHPKGYRNSLILYPLSGFERFKD